MPTTYWRTGFAAVAIVTAGVSGTAQGAVIMGHETVANIARAEVRAVSPNSRVVIPRLFETMSVPVR